MPLAKCGQCGAEHDGATGGDEAPKPGDVSVCIKCGTIATFGASLELVPMTPAQIEELPPIVRFVVLEARRAIRAGTLKP